jgi:hypothetical protein
MFLTGHTTWETHIDLLMDENEMPPTICGKQVK